MSLSANALRLVRLAGLLTWILAGASLLRLLFIGPGILAARPYLFWLIAYLAFGAVFLATPWRIGAASSRRVPLILVGVQVLLVLLMIRLVCSGYEGALLVLVALQLGWMLPPLTALAWILVQTALMGWFISITWPVDIVLRLVATYSGFEILALSASYFAVSEARARAELAETNAELRATRSLLADSSRLAERQRISRDLHDVLGHDLTALSLNLEVLAHAGDSGARRRAGEARDLARKLLGDVRSVVSAVRGDDGIDLARSLGALGEAFPKPRVHLQLPADLVIRDPLRAQALLRCTQEIVTNAARHSNAENLWIEFRHSRSGVEILARDDGRGAVRVQPGNGLGGMRQRLETFGGRLTVESGRDFGFRVQAWLPLEGKAT